MTKILNEFDKSNRILKLPETKKTNKKLNNDRTKKNKKRKRNWDFKFLLNHRNVENSEKKNQKWKTKFEKEACFVQRIRRHWAEILHHEN